MRTEAELIKHVNEMYLEITEAEHKQNMLTVIYACERMKDSDKAKSMPEEFLTLVECKQMLLVDVLRREWSF